MAYDVDKFFDEMKKYNFAKKYYKNKKEKRVSKIKRIFLFIALEIFGVSLIVAAFTNTNIASEMALMLSFFFLGLTSIAFGSFFYKRTY